MARGLKETGVTLHKLAPRFDAGSIILQRRIPIPETYDSIDLTIECARAADGMIREFLADPDRLWNEAVPQKGVFPAWFLPPWEERIITHDLTVAEARNRFRIFNRMVRIQIGEKEYNPEFFETGSAVFGPRVILAQDAVIYGLKDGHIRTRLLPADSEGNGRGRK
jgi:methionyl-tRNA formyltransferase